MKLSELKEDNLLVNCPASSIYSEDEITNIVFSVISDDLKHNKWYIVFGNSIQMMTRVKGSFLL